MRLSRISLIALAVTSHYALADDAATEQKDDQHIETLEVTSSPISRSVLTSATPVSILGGEELDQQQAATLGETLKNVPGVHSTYYGPVASSPIIRGMDGPRVKVVQNGLDTSDASRMGPDHAVSTETSTASQIEVMRGPATLLYGSGAIGGVVNVVDNRLPTQRTESISGEFNIQHETVSDGNSANLNLNGGSGDLAWHLDTFKRKTHDYEVPGYADADGDGEKGILENSSMDSDGYTLGGAWISDDSRIAFSYGRLNNLYGIPGHHHHEDEEEEHEEEEEEGVFGKVKQDRYQLVADWKNLDGLIQEVHWYNAYTDYQHQELEEGAVSTTISNDTLESRLWANLAPVDGWKGVVGLHYTNSDFSALGEEAFSPDTKSDTLAAFTLQEKQVGDLLWQLGLRLEKVDHKPDSSFYEDDSLNVSDSSYNVYSASAGVVWTLNDAQSVALNFARSERAPSASEIYANGEHAGTSTFELGAGFVISGDDDGYTIVASDSKVDKEISNNLDLTFRDHHGDVSSSISLFYNQVENYLYQVDTGLTYEDELPIYWFQQQDAKLYGFEAEADWHFADAWRWDAFADYTRAKLDDGTNVPRMPPLRIGTTLHWEQDQWHGEVGVSHYAKQDKTAVDETSTDGYTLLSASVNYYISLPQTDLTVYLKGDNLTDEEARVHSSFLKDLAPLPGRNFTLGVRASF